MPQTLHLLDASGFIFRAYHAIRTGLKTSDGTPTNAVYGFAQMLLKLLKEQSPEHLIPVFDVSRKSFRQELYPAYKANRPEPPPDLVPQFALIRELVAAFGLRPIEQEGFEADDLLGSLAEHYAQAGYAVCLISSDKDLLQLVDDARGIFVYDPWKDKTIRAAGVVERFGVQPTQVVDVLALAGDSSDNVPGVAGIGEKTAAQLIGEFGSLEALLGNLGRVKGKKQELLREQAAAARLAQTLVTIRRDVAPTLDLDDFRVRAFDRPELAELLTRLEFHQLLKSLELRPKAPASVPCEGPVQAAFRHEAYALIDTWDAFTPLLERLGACERFAFDCETHSLNALAAQPLVGLSFAWGPNEAAYLPLDHRGLGAKNLPKERVLAALAPLFADPQKRLIAHNAKFDAQVLESEGLRIEATLDDSMLLSYVQNPARRSHGLDALAFEILGHTMIPYEEVTGKGQKAISFAQVAPEQACRYSAEDTDAAWRLFARLKEELGDGPLWALYETMERPLLPILQGMERAGIRVDRAALTRLSAEFDVLLSDTEAQIHALAGGPFNIQSPPQLAQILFEKLGLPKGRKTKTGLSTDSDELQRLSALHPLPALVLDYRQNAKLRSTYSEALLELIDPRDGRVHTSYNQTVTLTGRLSSSHPNLQNIPVRTASGRLIRSAFVPAEGCVFLSADYSQVELRLLAHISQDPLLLSSFLRGEDIHARTAAEVFGGLPGMVDKEMRRRAKAINFGIVYGQTAFGLAESLGIPQREAKRYIDEYFARYAGVKRYIEEQQARAHREKAVTTLWGRRIPVTAFEDGAPGTRQYGERVAINAPIQGSAADLIKRAMIDLDRELKSRGLKTRLLLQVHDELLLEVPPEELETARELLKSAMEGAAALLVPLTADLGVGASWDEAH